MIETSEGQGSHAGMTAEIVAAYVANNHVALPDMPALIRSVHDALSSLNRFAVPDAPAAPLKPAVPIKRSVTDDYIISLEDGRRFKSMKRYLAGLGMTPADYRAKWGLPSDYPMVAPAYAAKRSELAKGIGLGSLRRKPAEDASAPLEEPADEPDPETSDASPPRGGRRTAA